MERVRIKVTSEQAIWIPDGCIVEVDAAYGKNLLDRGIGKLIGTVPIETAQAKEPETATLKRGRKRNRETANAR